MSRSSLVVIIFLTFLISDFHIGKVDCFICRAIASFANSLLFKNKPVNFYVHTHANTSPQKVSCNYGCQFGNLKFDPNRRTTVIIHGFMSNYKADWVRSLTKELFIWQDMNIIVVDWAEFFNLNYYQSAMRVVNVAVQVNEFLVQLAEWSNKDLKDWSYLHLIGHSIGAHVAGETAKILQEQVHVHRISALDPAGPYFDNEGVHLKLKKSSAQFVDVIHSNSSPNESTFGLYESLGHVDFYPNGGDNQPHCSGYKKKKRKRFFGPISCLSSLIFGMDMVPLKANFLRRMLRGNNMICDHTAAHTYFIESINGNEPKYTSNKVENIVENVSNVCNVGKCTKHDCVKMGMHSIQYNSSEHHGTYYVNTMCDYIN